VKLFHLSSGHFPLTPNSRKEKIMKKGIFTAVVILMFLFAATAWSGEEPEYYNSITDVPGIEVGQYTDKEALTGTTVILARGGAVGGVDVRGSAPGTRETDLLNPINLVDRVNAVVLSGGSAYGLAATDGVMTCLEDQGIGWPVGGGNVVPIVPSAILFDPGRCDTNFRDRPTAEFGLKACLAVDSGPVAQGNVGAGMGARAGGLKGGIGTASTDLGGGVIVGAIVAVNAVGSTVNPDTGGFYAAFLEVDDEFGKLKLPKLSSLDKTGSLLAKVDPSPAKNTTIAVVATNVELTKAQAQKIAQMAHDGMARAIRPSHTMFDGDTIFALGTGELSFDTLPGWGYAPSSVNRIGGAAADTLSRAIVHAMLKAESVDDCIISYCDAYPSACKGKGPKKEKPKH
jgi:L-aminopeptidase/D-esterase-like protein